MSVVKQKPPSPQVQAQDVSTSSSINSKIEELRQKFNTLRDYLNAKIVGHQEMVDATLLGLISGENVVLIGSPGTAKSMLASVVTESIQGARVFKYLLTKYTDYAELFGAIDVAELAKGNYTRRWSPIVSSDIIFLDEIFKANSAILNSLLSLLNEHIIYDPMTGQSIPTSNKLVIGASNEIPEEEELRALYDRFPIKVFIKYIQAKDIELALDATWSNVNVAKPNVTINDVVEAQDVVKKIFTMTIKTSSGNVTLIEYYKFIATSVISELRKEGIMLSDRTVISKIPKIVSAKVLLEGGDAVFMAPFDAIKLVAGTPEEKQKVEEKIMASLGSVNELANKLNNAKALIKAKKFDEAEVVLKEILQADLSKVPTFFVPVAKEIMRKAEAMLRKLDELSKQIENDDDKSD